MSIIIHCKENCIFCVKTKDFLDSLLLDYIIISYDDPNTYLTMKDKLIEKTGYKQFPQIFIDDKFIGGYNDLIHIYNTNQLHILLKEIGIVLDYDF